MNAPGGPLLSTEKMTKHFGGLIALDRLISKGGKAQSIASSTQRRRENTSSTAS